MGKTCIFYPIWLKSASVKIKGNAVTVIANLNPTQQAKWLSNPQISGTYEWDNYMLLAFLDPLVWRMIFLKCLQQPSTSPSFSAFFPRLGKLYDVEHTKKKHERQKALFSRSTQANYQWQIQCWQHKAWLTSIYKSLHMFVALFRVKREDDEERDKKVKRQSTILSFPNLLVYKLVYILVSTSTSGS